MASRNRDRSGAPSPSPSRNTFQYQRPMPTDIDWTNVPFGPHELPEGRWGRNKAGDNYLTCPDGTYHYFNADGSYYHRRSAPGPRAGPPASIYVSPRSERFVTPAEDEVGAEYFIGRNWRTGEENVYVARADDTIVRSFRKNVADVRSDALAVEYVAVDERYRPRLVDRFGNPVGGRGRREELEMEVEVRGVRPVVPVVPVVKREMDVVQQVREVKERSPSQSQSRTVLGSPPPRRESKEGRCCVCM